MEEPTTSEEIAASLADPDHGRANARALASRLRWGVDDATRAEAVKALRSIVNGEVKAGPRTRMQAIRTLAELNKQDQADVHHLEGSKVNIAATVSKAPDEEAAELLAEMRRGDLKPRAN